MICKFDPPTPLLLLYSTKYSKTNGAASETRLPYFTRPKSFRGL